MELWQYSSCLYRASTVLRRFLLLQTDEHNYKIIVILKQLKFRLSLRHVSVHAGTIFRELFRAWLKLQI
jgi:hypothetical protein